MKNISTIISMIGLLSSLALPALADEYPLQLKAAYYLEKSYPGSLDVEIDHTVYVEAVFADRCQVPKPNELRLTSVAGASDRNPSYLLQSVSKAPCMPESSPVSVFIKLFDGLYEGGAQPEGYSINGNAAIRVESLPKAFGLTLEKAAPN